ncbi:hypothetical protein OG871_29165 [Kitasatospora sp. NBC_00374]|uniref:hypothetical protein n=1 Tax=Kitasatospora sp. NBC_00374 TaxID=2975964 RepID=UPI003243EF70
MDEPAGVDGLLRKQRDGSRRVSAMTIRVYRLTPHGERSTLSRSTVRTDEASRDPLRWGDCRCPRCCGRQSPDN